jgi:hypothetical protein
MIAEHQPIFRIDDSKIELETITYHKKSPKRGIDSSMMTVEVD